MKKVFAVAVVFCLVVPGLALGQEEKKPPTPLQVYMGEKTPDNFVNAYNAYTAQLKDTMNFSAMTTLAWLSLFEADKYLEILKENEANLTNMNRFQYANILLEMNRFDDAIAFYVQLNEKSPKWSCPWRHKGQAYFMKKDYAAAEEALLKSIETRKEHYDAYMWLADVYSAWGKYDKGLETFKQGQEQYGKDIEDPEKEYSSAKAAFIHLDLLKGAGKANTEEYKHALEHAKKLAPEDERLAQY